jgi:DNA-binding MarR family transcriptional regulator
MHPEPIKLAGQIRRVTNRLIFLEKRSVFRHEGLRLHPSEIHLMQVIAEHPDLNAGQMAQKLGVSNGAVSQTLARLERKGVIKKAKDPSLKNRVSAAFTASGRQAIQRFERNRPHLWSLSPLSGRTLRTRKGSDRELSFEVDEF